MSSEPQPPLPPRLPPRLPPEFRHGIVPVVVFFLAMSLWVWLSNVLANWWLGPDPEFAVENAWRIGSGLVQAAIALSVLRYEGIRPKDIAATRGHFTKALAAIAVFIVTLNVVVAVLGILRGQPLDFGVFALYRRAPFDLTLAAIGLSAFSLYVIVGPVEELAFRGYLQNKLVRLLGGAASTVRTAAGIGAAGVLFALMHVPTLLLLGDAGAGEALVGLSGLAITGIVFGVLYVLTQNLFLVAFLHGVGNFWPLFIDPGAGNWPNWIVVGVLYVALVWLYRRWT